MPWTPEGPEEGAEGKERKKTPSFNSNLYLALLQPERVRRVVKINFDIIISCILVPGGEKKILFLFAL